MVEQKDEKSKKKLKSKKGLIIWGIVLIIILISLIIVAFTISKKEKMPVSGEPGQKLMEILQKKQDFDMNVKKKNKGKAGDLLPPEVVECIVSSPVLDLKKNIYVKITLKIKDESGVFRANLLFSDGKKEIGFIVKNPNSKEKDITVEYIIDNNNILAGLKTFKQYEGIKPILKFMIYDNNLNIAEYTPTQGFEIIDNQAPDKPKAYWTYAGEQPPEVEIYSKEYKNKFIFTKVVDNPVLEGNIVTKYDYGYFDSADNKLLLRVGIEPIVEPRKEVEIEVDRDGKYIFFVRAYDLKGNFSERNVKFFIDKTPPTMDPVIEGGLEVSIATSMKIQLNAKDNLSGIFRYRIGATQDGVYSSPWQDYSDDKVSFEAASDEGIKDVWIQVEDNAMNICKPVSLNYYAKVKKTIDITSQDNDKTRTMEVDKDAYNREGKINIESSREK